MKILNISHSDSLGAGKAVSRLHNNFLSNNYDSKLIVLNRNYLSDETYQYKNSIFTKVKNRVNLWRNRRIRERVYAKYCFFNISERGAYNNTNKLLDLASFRPNVIIIHWISQFINCKNLYELQAKTKAHIIWHVLDMAPLTGGCHYAWNCKRYQSFCGSCPAINSNKEQDITFYNMRDKLKYIDNLDMTIVAPTQILYKQCIESKLFNTKPIKKIMLACDPQIFKPGEKAIAKNTFGILNDQIVLFVGSSNLQDERKGITYLISELKTLYKVLPAHVRKKIIIIFAGKNSGDLFNELPFNSKFLNYLDTDEDLAMAYKAADIFLCSSIEDSGPMMINEALMCGTPVVAYDTGVAQEVIINGMTGFKADIKKKGSFAQGIIKLLLESNRYEVSQNCRNLALENFTPQVQFEKFSQLILRNSGSNE